MSTTTTARTAEAAAVRPGRDHPVAGLPRRRLRPHLRPAAVRLHVAPGALRRLPLPQGRVGADRHPARLADQHRRADRRPARRPAVAARRPLGPLQGHHLDGRPVEPRHPRLRHRGQLRADDARPLLHRPRRGGLRQRRPRGRPDGLLPDQARLADRCVHGRRLLRLGARRLPRRHPRRPARLALVLRRDGHPRPGAGRAVRAVRQRRQPRPQPAPRQRPGHRRRRHRRPARQAAHPGLHPRGDLRLRRQRPAALHGRRAVRLAAQLPQPRLRPRARTRPASPPPASSCSWASA